MPAGDGDGVDHLAPELVGELAELLGRQPAQIGRQLHGIEERGLALGHPRVLSKQRVTARRSEERRVGNDRVSPSRVRLMPEPYKKKTRQTPPSTKRRSLNE